MADERGGVMHAIIARRGVCPLAREGRGQPTQPSARNPVDLARSLGFPGTRLACGSTDDADMAAE